MGSPAARDDLELRHIHDAALNQGGPVYQELAPDSIKGVVDEHAYQKVPPPSYNSTPELPGGSADDYRGGERVVHPVKRCHEDCSVMCTQHSGSITKVVLTVLFVAYTVYFGFALRFNVEWSKALIVITSLALFLIVYTWVKRHFGPTIYQRAIHPVTSSLQRSWFCLKWFVYPALVIALVLYLVLDVVKEPRQLQSLSGMVVIILLEYVTSKHPDRIRWRPVIWGFALQFILAIIVLRWKNGYNGLKWVSQQIETFINYGFEGAATVFGDPFIILHPFAFMGMPLLIYVGAVMAVLYYIGVTQILAVKLGWVIHVTMGTTAIESLGVGGNIFLNGMDMMLMLRNYLHKLTKSEFHCFLVGNHATVAGFAFGLFVLFGAPPQHLLSAAVMSAPATIAIAKLNYPETELSHTDTEADIILEKGEETNVIEAGANGAAVAGKTVFTVIVNFIGFVSLLAFVNTTLSWLGGRVGFPQLSFEIICSYLFWPISLLMGVEVQYCREVAKLIGIKICTSEVLAYQELGESIERELHESPRSTAIATYALCGFSGVSTLAIAVGVWNTVCPAKTRDMTQQMWRAIINANMSCFMTACVAGLMYNTDVSGEPPDESTPIGNFVSAILDIIPGYKDLMSAV